jgi:hypothetical protein
MEIIAKLSDTPNVDDGLTAFQLKEKFDEGGRAIKDYINNTLLQEVAEKPATFTGTFRADNWSSSAPFTQEIAVEGILQTDYPFVDIDLSMTGNALGVIEDWRLVGRCSVSADNVVKAYCYEEKPTVDIPVIFKVVR